MHPYLRNYYHTQILKVEEPIRDIVKALWEQPFVVNTTETCCGHIVSRDSSVAYERARIHPLGYVGWYPHRATLKLEFSLEDHVAERDAFIRDLKEVAVAHDTLRFAWTTASEYQRASFGYDNTLQILDAWYEADVPDGPKTYEYVVCVESLLTQFWDEVARVIMQHAPGTTIPSVKGKDFRTVINWTTWQIPNTLRK